MANRVWTVAVAIALAMATLATASVAYSQSQRASGVPLTRSLYTDRSDRVVARLASGPSMECHGDVCGIGLANRVRFHFHARSDTYRAIVTVSLDYRASAGDSFTIRPRVRVAGQQDAQAADETSVRPRTSPKARVITTTRSGSGTFQWFVSGLRSATNYNLTFEAGIDHLGGQDAYSIKTDHLLVTVEQL